MTKIKILTTSGKSEDKFIKEIEKHLVKNWRIKGDLFVYDGCLRVMIYKDTINSNKF